MGDESESAAMEEEKPESDLDSDFEFDDEIKQSLDCLLKMPMESGDDSSEEEEHNHGEEHVPRHDMLKVKLRDDSVEKNLEALFVDQNERREVNTDLQSGKDTGLESISENEFDGPESGECDTSDGELPDSPNIVVTLPDSPPRLPSRESFIPGLDRVSADDESDIELVEEYQNRSSEYNDSLNNKITPAKLEREVVIGSKGKDKKVKEHKKDKSAEKKIKDKKVKKKTLNDKAEFKRKLKLKKYLCRLDQYRAKCLEYMSQISEKCDIIKKDESRKIKLEKSRIKSMIPLEKVKSVVEKVNRHKESSPNSSSVSSHSSKFGKYSKEDIKKNIAFDKAKKSKIKNSKRGSSREEKEHKLKYHKYIQYLQTEREKCYEDSEVLDKYKHKSNQRKLEVRSTSSEQLKDRYLPFNRPPVMSFSEFCSSRELISPDRESPKKQLLRHNHNTDLRKERTISIDSEATTVTMRSEPPAEEEKDLFVTYTELLEKDLQDKLGVEEENKEKEDDPEMKSISVFTSVLFKGSSDASGIPFIQEDKPPSPKVTEPVKPKPLYTQSNDLDELYDCNDDFSSISQSSFSPSHSPVPKVHNKALLNFVENQKERLENKNDRISEKNPFKSNRSRSRTRSPRKDTSRTRKLKTKHHSSISISPSPPPLRLRSPESYKRKKSPLSHLKDRWRDYPPPIERRKEYYEKPPRIHKRSRSRTRVRSGHRSRSSSEERYFRHYRSHSRSRSRSPPLLSPAMVQISAAEKRRRLKEEHERALASLRATMRKPTPNSTPLSITFKADGSSDNYDPVGMNEDSSSLSPGELTPSEVQVSALPPLPPGLPPEPPPVPRADKSEDRATSATYTSFPNSNLVQTLNYVSNEMTPFNNWMAPNITQIGEVGSSMPHLYPSSQVLNNYDQFNTPPPQPFSFLNQPPPPLPYQIQVQTPCHQHYRMTNQNINMINVHQEIKSVTHTPLLVTQMTESTDYVLNNTLEASKCKHNLLGHNNQTVQEAIDSVKNCLKNCDGNKNKDPRLVSVDTRSKSPEKIDISNSPRRSRGQQEKVKITLNYRPRPVSTVKDVCVFDKETEVLDAADIETGVRNDNEVLLEKSFNFSSIESKGNTERSYDIQENNTFNSKDSLRYQKPILNLGAEPYDPFDTHDDDFEDIKSVGILKGLDGLKDQTGCVRTFKSDSTAYLSNVEIDSINHHVEKSFAFIFSHTIERKRLTPTTIAIAVKKKESTIKQTYDNSLTISKQVDVKQNIGEIPITRSVDDSATKCDSVENSTLQTNMLKEKDFQPNKSCEISASDGRNETLCSTINNKIQSVCPKSELTFVATKNSPKRSDETNQVVENNFERNNRSNISLPTTNSSGVVEVLENKAKITKIPEEIVFKEKEIPISTNKKTNDNDEAEVELKGQPKDHVNNDFKDANENKSLNDTLNFIVENITSVNIEKPFIENKNRGIIERRGIPSLSIPTKGELKRFPTPERSLPNTSKGSTLNEKLPACEVMEILDGDNSKHNYKSQSKEEKDVLAPTKSIVDSIIDDFEDSNSTGSDSQDKKKNRNEHQQEKLGNSSSTRNEESKTSRFIKLNESDTTPEIKKEEIIKSEPKMNIPDSNEYTRCQMHVTESNKCLTTQKHSRKNDYVILDATLDQTKNNVSTINNNQSSESKLTEDTEEGDGLNMVINPSSLFSNQEKCNDAIYDKKAKSCPLSKKNNSYISQNLPTSFDLNIDGHLIKKGFKKLQVKVKKMKEVSNDSSTDQDESLPSFEDDTSCSTSYKTDISEPVVQNSDDGNSKEKYKDCSNPIKLKKKVSFNMIVSEIMDIDPRQKDINLTKNSVKQNIDQNHTDVQHTKETAQFTDKEKESITTTLISHTACETQISKNVCQSKQNEISKNENLSNKTRITTERICFDFSTYYRNILHSLHVFHKTPPQLQNRKSLALSIPKPEDMQEAKIKEAPKRGLNLKNNQKPCTSDQSRNCFINESYQTPKCNTEHQHLEGEQTVVDEDKTNKNSGFLNDCQIRKEKEVEKKRKQEKETDAEDSSFLDRELSDLAKGCLDSDEDSILNFGIVPSDDSSDDSNFNLKWKSGTLRTSARQKSKLSSSQNIKRRFTKKNTTIDCKNNVKEMIENEDYCLDGSSQQDRNILTTNKSSKPDKIEEKELKKNNQPKDNKHKSGHPKINMEKRLDLPSSPPPTLDFSSCEEKEIKKTDASVDRPAEVNCDTDCPNNVLLGGQHIPNQGEDSNKTTIENCENSVQDILISTEKVLKNQSNIMDKVSTQIENVKKDQYNENALDGTGILYGYASENPEDSNTSTLRKVRRLKVPKILTQREETTYEINPNIINSCSTGLERHVIPVNRNNEELNSINNIVDLSNNVGGEVKENDAIQDQQLENRRTSKRKCVGKKLVDNKNPDIDPNSISFDIAVKRTRSRNKIKEDNVTLKKDISELQNNVIEPCELSEDSRLKRTSKLRNVRKGRKNYNEANLIKVSIEKEQNMIQMKSPGAEKTFGKSEVQLNAENISSSCYDDVAKDSRCETGSKSSEITSDISTKSYKNINPKKSNQEKDNDLEKNVDNVLSLVHVRQTRSSARLKCELNDVTDTKDAQDYVDKKDSLDPYCTKSLSLKNKVDYLNFPKDEKSHKEEFLTESKNICTEVASNIFENKLNKPEVNFKSDDSKSEIDFKCLKSVLDQENQSQEIKDKIKACVSGNTSENTKNVQETNGGGKSDDHPELNSTGDTNIPNDSSDLNSDNIAEKNSSNSLEPNLNESSKKNLSSDSLIITPFTLNEKNVEHPIVTEKMILSVASKNISINPKLKEALRKKRDKAEVDAEIKRRLAEIDELEKLARTQHASLLGKIGTRTRSKVDLTNPEKSHEEEEDDIVSISSEDSNTTSVDTIETRLSVTTIGEPSKTEESTNDEPTTTLEDQANKLQLIEPNLKDNIRTDLSHSSSKPTVKQTIENIMENPLIPVITQTTMITNNQSVHHSISDQSVDLVSASKSSNSEFHSKMPSRKRMVLETSNSTFSTHPIELINEPKKRARRNVASVYQFRDDENDLLSNQEHYRKFQSNRSVRNRQFPTLQRKKGDVSITIKSKTLPVNQDKSISNLKSENNKNLLPEPDSSTSSLANIDCESKSIEDHVRQSISLIEKKKEEVNSVESSVAYLSIIGQDPITSESSNSDIFRQPFRKSSISRKRRKKKTFYSKLESLSTKQLDSASEGDNHNDICASVDEQSEEVVSSSVTNIPNPKLSQMKKRRKRKTCVDLLMEDSMLSVAKDFPMSPNPYMLPIYREIDTSTSKKTITKDISAEKEQSKKLLENFDSIPKPDVLAQKLRLLEKLKYVNRRNRKTRQCRTLVCYNEDSLPESLVESPVSESAVNQNDNTSLSQDSGPNEENEKVGAILDVSSTEVIALTKESSFKQNIQKSPRVVLKKKPHKISQKRKIKGLPKKNHKSKDILQKDGSDEHVGKYNVNSDKSDHCKEESSSDIERSKEQSSSAEKMNKNVSLKDNEGNQKDEPSEFDKLLQSSTTSHLRYNFQPTSPRSQDEDKSNDVYDDFFDSFPSPLHSDSDYDSSEDKIRNSECIMSTDLCIKKPAPSGDQPSTNYNPSIPRQILCSILKSRIGKVLPHLGNTSSDDDCDENLPLSEKLLREEKKPTANRDNFINSKLEQEMSNQLTAPNCQAKKINKRRFLRAGCKEKTCRRNETKNGSFDKKEIISKCSTELIDTDSEKDTLCKIRKTNSEPTRMKNTRKAKSLKVPINENNQQPETEMFGNEHSQEIVSKKSTDELYKNELENNVSLKRRGRPAKTKAALKENLSEDPKTKSQTKVNLFIKEKLSKEVQENYDFCIDNNESMQLRKRRGRNLRTVYDKSLNNLLFGEPVDTDKILEKHEKGIDFDDVEEETPCLDFCQDIICQKSENINQNRFKSIKLDSQSNETRHKNEIEKDEPYEELPLDKRILDTSKENKMQEDLVKSTRNQSISPKLHKENVSNENVARYSYNLTDPEINNKTELDEGVSFDGPPPPLIKLRARRAKTKKLETDYLDPPNLTTFGIEVPMNDKEYLENSLKDPGLPPEIESVLPSRKRGRKPKGPNVTAPQNGLRLEHILDINDDEQPLDMACQSENPTQIEKEPDGSSNKHVSKKPCKRSKRKASGKKVNSSKNMSDEFSSELKSSVPKLKSCNHINNQILDPVVDQTKQLNPEGGDNTETNSLINVTPAIQKTARKQFLESTKESSDVPTREIHGDFKRESNEDKDNVTEIQNIDKDSVTKEKEFQENPSSQKEYKDTQSSSCGNQSLLWNKISDFLNKSTRSVGTQVKIKNMALKGFDTSEPVVSLQSELTLPQVIKTLFEELKTLDSSFSDP